VRHLKQTLQDPEQVYRRDLGLLLGLRYNVSQAFWVDTAVLSTIIFSANPCNCLRLAIVVFRSNYELQADGRHAEVVMLSRRHAQATLAGNLRATDFILLRRTRPGSRSL
jgi:hypothetical protein